MTFVGPVPASATLREESWNRSSSFWDMFPFRRRNATWVASSGFDQRSMIRSESNLVLERQYSRSQPGTGSTMALKLEADGWITTGTKSMR
jgi:hypothetical protein